MVQIILDRSGGNSSDTGQDVDLKILIVLLTF